MSAPPLPALLACGADRRPVRSWEFATSLDFDLAFLTGKKKFSWPLVRRVSPARAANAN